MNKRKKGRSLGREKAQKKALLRTLLVSLIENKKIVTTLPKAKELQPFAERSLSLAKRGLKNETEKVSKTRLLKKDLPMKSIVELFEIAKISTREGGYTRIIKLMSRKSDFAKMAMIEWVDTAKLPEKKVSEKKPEKKKAEKEPTPKNEKKETPKKEDKKN